MKRVLFFLALASAIGCGPDETATASQPATPPTVVLDIKDIAGKSFEDVRAIYGEPIKRERQTGYPCEKSKCELVVFDSNKLEVVFKNGKADYITYFGPNLISDPQALAKIGLENAKPDFASKNVDRYIGVGGFLSVQFFPDYVLVQVSKPD